VKWSGLCLILTVFVPTDDLLAQRKAPSADAARDARRPSSFEALVKRAEAARQADLTDEAIRMYQEVVKAKPGYAEGWWYLGTLLYETDRYSEGRAAFRHVTGLKPEMAVAWAMLGLCEFEIKAYDNALLNLRRADELRIPRQQSFYDVAKYHLALLYIRAGQFEPAIKIISDFAREGKDGPQFVEAMGLAGLRKPLLPTELPPLEREMVLDIGRALCDSSARRAAQAERDRTEILKKYPNTPEVHFLAGTMALGNDSDQALEEWKAELALSPSHPQALASIAGEYLKRHDYQSALPYAERAIEAGPGFFAAHAILGQILAEGNVDIPRGISELESAVRLAPLQPQVHFALATAYTKAGRKDDAAKERAEFLRLRGQDEVAVSKQ
jgi:tetratricopeptide (TPR) repeat protein